MKKASRLIITVILTTFALASTAQVKQVFKITEFETGKPVAGATTTLLGQKLTTNAQGVAVANFKTDQKGAYLPLEDWNLEGYVFFYSPESNYQFLQSADTLKIYAVPTKTWRAERFRVFENIYRHMYDSLTIPVAREIQDSLDLYMPNSLQNANDLTQSTFNTDHYIHNYYDDAGTINKYYLLKFEPKTYGEAINLLAEGRINDAVQVARKHIRMDDNSMENLRWVDLYMTLRDLNTAEATDDSYSNYTKLLYDNHYSPVIAIEYLRNLNREQLYDRADSVAAIERIKNKNPRYKDAFYPNFVRYMVNPDKAMLKTRVEENTNIALDNYAKYPTGNFLQDLIWQYRVNNYAYAFMEDSVSATRTVDSSIACVYRFIQDPNLQLFSKNQYLIDFFYSALDVVKDGYYPAKSAFRLRNEIYRAAKENYENDPDNLFLQLQLSECASEWLQYYNAEDFDEADSFYTVVEVLRQLNDIDTKLSAEFPEMFVVQNVGVATELLTNTVLDEKSTNEQQLDAFRRYERSFDAVNTLFPKLYIEKYLRLNKALDSYFTVNQVYVLTNELTAFTDRLISIREDNDPQKILVAKADMANATAESLYSNEGYEEAVAYYMQANEYYQKALPNDESLWIPYLSNYLQMGDAHLNQNQYDKAMMTYQKILDFESQIPASVVPEYTAMKGNVNYYVGDVYKSTGDMKSAEKEYKAAEKWFKKAIAMGDTTAYQSLGEMYWGKAVVAAQNEDMKKCQQLLETSVGYYEKCAMNRPLTRYERAKATLGALYEQNKQTDKYYANLKGLNDFYRKFVDADEDYAVGLVQSAEGMLNSGTLTKEEALTYSKDLITGVIALNDAGRQVDLAYLRSLFNLAKVYTANDSVQQAIDLYRDCANVSEYMFADTAMDTHKGNMAEIYLQLANCYELMAEEIDTAHSENWYYRAIDVRDTLIDLMKELNKDGNVNLTYKTALQYRNNAIVFYNLEMIPSAQDYLDKSTDLLMMLYNSEFKAEVENDVIQNYFLKGAIYQENDNEEKALQYLRKAVDFGERVESGNVSPYYIATLGQLIEILEKDKTANAAEIEKLAKKMKEESKKLK